MKFLQGKYIRGEVYFPVPLHFLDKNSPRGEVLHHLRKKSVIKYLKGTPNKKKVKLNRSIVGGFILTKLGNLDCVCSQVDLLCSQISEQFLFLLQDLSLKKQPKTSKMTHLWRFGGYQKWHLGAQIKILKPLFNTNTPLKPSFRHFGNHFGPRKSDFWPFYFFLVIFPFKFPLKPKKSTHIGRKGRRLKTKTLLKPVNQVAKLARMQNNDF